MMTDPIADMLTRIRNALMVKKEHVDVPSSRMKRSIVEILKAEGFISNYVVIDDGKQGVLRIYLKYDESGNPVIRGLKRISKPGRRIYAPCNKLPRPRRGTGIAIVSTSKGVLSDTEARKQGVGGEIICEVW